MKKLINLFISLFSEPGFNKEWVEDKESGYFKDGNIVGAWQSVSYVDISKNGKTAEKKYTTDIYQFVEDGSLHFAKLRDDGVSPNYVRWYDKYRFTNGFLKFKLASNWYFEGSPEAEFLFKGDNEAKMTVRVSDEYFQEIKFVRVQVNLHKTYSN
ncbi:hypothetical protein [Sphingobacterium hungaricum]